MDGFDDLNANQLLRLYLAAEDEAEAGLLQEAAAEFRAYLQKNPNSQKARKFLNQLASKK